ncbi:hypothetical protein BH11MYX2_BH11MYX2_07750 [soil metagenome]
MGPQTEDASSRGEARAHRRWLIGISITVVFGIFGAVMALLAYTNAKSAPPRPRGAIPSGTSAPAVAAPAPSDEPRGKEHRKDHGKGHGGD